MATIKESHEMTMKILNLSPEDKEKLVKYLLGENEALSKLAKAIITTIKTDNAFGGE